MMQMIGYEFGKIFRKKMVYAALLFVGFMSLSMYIARGIGQEVVLGPDGKYILGKEAVRLDKEIAARYKGPLTEEKVEEILGVYAPAAPDAAFWKVNATYDVVSTFWAENDGSRNGLSIREAFPGYEDERELVWDYNRGWINFIEMGMYMMVFIGCLLVIALSPVFSEEYTRGTDALILASRHGKGRCARAKLLASYLFTLLSTGALLIPMSLGFFLDYGPAGGGCSIQLNNHWILLGTPYFLSCMEAAGLCLLLWVSGSLILTAVTLTISALCKTSFLAVIVSLCVYGLPSLFAQMGMPPKLFSLNPIWCFLAEQLIMIPKIWTESGAGLSYVWVIVVFALLMTGLSFRLGRRIFAGHQVV